MPRPRIGLTTYLEPVEHHGHPRPAGYLPATYLDSVVAAGGVPVLLPPVDPALAADAIEGLAAVIVTGGHDVDPARYGAERHPATEASRPERDAWEDAIWSAALAADLPVLGICRGLQTLNVHLGGGLIQHLPDVLGHARTSGQGAEYATNDALLVAGSPFAAFFDGRERIPVRTYHHQGVGDAQLAPGLDVVARSEDGLVYAVAVAGRRWAYAVQWHPEEAPDDGLFAALMTAAAAAVDA